MPLVTEGGFPASSNPDLLDVIDAKIPGTTVNFPGGVAAFAAPLLMWVALQIHLRVEPAHAGWCWGWNFRDVRGGSTVMSDHAGAVAIDYNAPAHPRGLHGTWSDKQVTQIRAILAEANAEAHVIAWGHDFNTTVDDMHFACRGTKAQVMAAGARLSRTKEWDEMATKAEIRDVVDNALAAVLPKMAAAAGDAALAKVTDALSDPDSPLSKKVRNNVRIAVQAELVDERAGTNPGQ